MLTQLKAMGLQVVAVSNDPVRGPLQQSSLAAYIDHIVERVDVGKAKGSPLWVDRFRELTGLEPHQLFYVGDSDHDMITATRGPMIYAHAMWSCPPGQYGLQALSPNWVVNVIRHIFRKQHPWYWTLDATDSIGRPVHAMTLIDGNGAGSTQTKQRLLWLLKDNIDVTIPTTPMMLSEFVMLHMLASVYDTNLFGGAHLWTTYPGHAGEPNDVMGGFLEVAAKLSRNKYRPALLVRHTEAMRSRDARGSEGRVGALRNQLETVHVEKKYERQLSGKRVLLLDNFLTWGYSTESARNLLLNAGAAEVMVACVGKYGPRINVISPSDEDWNAFEKERPDAARFQQSEHRGVFHQEALEEFVESLRGIRRAMW